MELLILIATEMRMNGGESEAPEHMAQELSMPMIPNLHLVVCWAVHAHCRKAHVGESLVSTHSDASIKCLKNTARHCHIPLRRQQSVKNH